MIAVFLLGQVLSLASCAGPKETGKDQNAPNNLMAQESGEDTADVPPPTDSVRTEDPEGAPSQPAPTDEPENAGPLEDVPLAPQLLVFVWPDLQSDDVATLDPASVPITIKNPSESTLDLEVFAATDNAERPTRIQLGEFTLAPEQETLLSLDVTVGGTVNTDELKYSGSATVLAHVVDEQGDYRGLYVSATAFYHPNEGGQIVLYLEEKLKASFRSGDYQDLHGDDFVEEGVVLDRVVYGGEGEVQPLGTPIADQ